MSGLQYPKHLRLLFHDPGNVTSPDASTQHVFDEGHRIGERIGYGEMNCSCIAVSTI